MVNFEDEYNKLNPEQKSAVDIIDGPLLVLAGPGTGKTTLLATRAANILRVTDSLPSNILCLTFTDSGQRTMQERIVALAGQDAYKMHIQTFHGFGSWAMRTYPEHFKYYFGYTQADDVARYQIFNSIFERLPHNSFLASMNDGDYIYLKDSMSRVGQLKQAGVDPDQLSKLCKLDDVWIKKFNKLLEVSLAGMKTITNKSIPAFRKLLETMPVSPESKLGVRCRLELSEAMVQANDGDKLSTKPITAWKNNWLAKTGESIYIAKAAKDCEKLSSLADIYEKYQKLMKQTKLVDYDDLLMTTLQALRSNKSLLAELQEQFQYIMVDEYQDTSGVQQQILDLIADNPVNENKPNLMVVGDDDQAIYGFQGAYSSNVLDFLKRWEDVQTVTLKQNFRSTPEIVSFARSIIVQGNDRLESSYKSINKELYPDKASGPEVQLVQSTTDSGSLAAVAGGIKKYLDEGREAETIAVLAPKHAHLEAIVPHLDALDIATRYERRQNVLEEKHIYELCLLAKTIYLMEIQDLNGANNLLPQLLSLPWWGIDPQELWQISLAAHNSQKGWLEVIQSRDNTKLKTIVEWLIEQSVAARHTPIESMLDKLIGSENQDKVFDSPFRRYYFNNQTEPGIYLYLLTSLLAIRRRVREYAGTNTLLLKDFVNYIALSKASGLHIVNDHPVTTGQHAVQLMTAHKAKGLEFDIVYLLKADQSGWANNRGRSNLINMPPHIAAVPSGNNDDERLRLFYVAVTRAKNQLVLATSKSDDGGKAALPLGWLANKRTFELLKIVEDRSASPEATLRTLQFEWFDRHVHSSMQPLWREALHDNMQSYRLSPTHLNAFLDVSRGGPRAFLLNQLLKFPHALGPNASFGNSMHHTMEYLHDQYRENVSLPPIAAAVKYFKRDLEGYNLGEIETPKQLARGEYAIEHIYKNNSGIFETNQITEKDFAYENVMLDDIRLRGKIDLLLTEPHEKTVIITDYKTGKPSKNWPKLTTNSYEALKLHRYRQQLLFYKLLIDGSREYGGKFEAAEGRVVFLEAGGDDNLVSLAINYDRDEVERIKMLIRAVWKKIINLDLPDTSSYSPDLAGMLDFENDLIENFV